MKVVWLIVFLALLAASESRRKRKFEGDFEFAEEEETRNNKKPDKKRWIFDPTSDLCRPLNCKKKEVCLLEDSFTAVCVSMKELHRNGDIIIPKAKLKETEVTEAEEELDDEDDDEFYDSEDDSDDEDVDTNTRCRPCPVVKPTFLCGTDNRTYSSLCRLEYHNCIHHTPIRVDCKGFCPCKDADIHQKKKQKQAERISNFVRKYKATMEKEKERKEGQEKYTFTPEDIKYEDKHYKYIKYTKYNKNTVTNPPFSEDKERQRGYNDVLPNKVNKPRPSWSKVAPVECSSSALEAMGNRLLDWFSVVMAEAKKDKTRRRSHKAKVHFPMSCKSEVRWMFQHLDTDGDEELSLQELFDLEHDRSEHCIKPFLDKCDVDKDIFMSPREWCKCFDKSDRPCAAVKRRITSDLVGAYVPDCDTDGYYRATQCHSSVGMCWCVDRHGVEFANTRIRGKPDCETIIGKTSEKTSESSPKASDDEDDGEGSADQPLDF